MRKITIYIFLIMLLMMSLLAYTQDATTIQKKLVSQYALTQPTADNTDIVTAGAVLVLQKDQLKMISVSSQIPYESTYKDGKIDLKGAHKFIDGLNRFHMPGTTPSPTYPTRTFVRGEKMWVTGINIKGNSVVFNLLTDAYNDVRFKASVIFPFNTGAMPDDVAKLVGEVFTIQPGGEDNADTAPANRNQQPSPPPTTADAASAVPPPPPDAPSVVPPPPPPPPDAPQAPPKTITLGQTPDQVVAVLGQPEKTAKIGNKQTYFYKDMKVIFVGGKVIDVQ